MRLAERAYERLRDDIVFLRVEPGEPLDEKRLSESLGVGLTPIRDAFKRLALEHLVVTYPRRGTFVADISISDERWLTEIRNDLEGLAAALAAERATPAECQALASLAARLENDQANHLTASYHGLDYDIHQAIYAAAHNPFLEDSLSRFLNLTMRIWHYGLRQVPIQHSPGRDQQRVVAAIVAGDADAARAAALEHLGDFSAAVRSLLVG